MLLALKILKINYKCQKLGYEIKKKRTGNKRVSGIFNYKEKTQEISNITDRIIEYYV